MKHAPMQLLCPVWGWNFPAGHRKQFKPLMGAYQPYQGEGAVTRGRVIMTGKAVLSGYCRRNDLRLGKAHKMYVPSTTS